MRLEDVEESSNVEDRRGRPSAGKLAAGGGIGTIVIALLVMVLGGDPQQVLNGAGQGGGLGGSMGGASRQAPSTPAQDDEGSRFVKKVLKETEDVWTKLFRQVGREYEKPVLVLFTDRVQSACGTADAAVGPFYCPGDNQVYIDLGFYQTMRDQLGADGDFAQAYVIAHEVGHHIQNLLGTSNKVEQLRRRMNEKEGNKVTVRMELQADFYAGVWAHHAQNLKLDRQDIEEAMNAAHSIGDDTLQKRSQGYVVPDAFTHGSSEQRMRWFMKGYETGDIRQGDTFNARSL
jgi:uncharacterized protein